MQFGLKIVLRGRVVFASGRHYEVETADGRRLRAFPKSRREAFACGDLVEIDAHGAVVSMQPRTSLFYRSDALREKIIAANADQVLVVVATEPGFDSELASRALVAAEHQRLGALVVLNKTDLAARLPEARAKLAPFACAGYPIVELCALRDVSPLLPHLAGRTSVLVGGSGAGKSSLVNALVPGTAARTREISRALGAGKHTTTAARFYRLGASGAIIDSPGMQRFGLAHVPAGELAECFPELRTHAGHCRFRDCRHATEPGCAVLQAVRSGDLSAVRHAHFLALHAELAHALLAR